MDKAPEKCKQTRDQDNAHNHQIEYVPCTKIGQAGEIHNSVNPVGQSVRKRAHSKAGNDQYMPSRGRTLSRTSSPKRFTKS